MKTKNLLTLCGSAIAAGIIASLMYTVRGLLPSIATKVILVILLIASLTALYVVGLLVKRLHSVITDIKLKHLEHSERSQRLLMDRQRHNMEMLALQTEMHLKLTRVYAGNDGIYPVILPQMQTQIQPSQLDYLMLPAAHSAQAGRETTNDRLLPAASILPDAPVFREIMQYILPARMVNGKQVEAQVVLACTQEGMALGKVQDWLSTLLVGRPGMGKSTALYFFVAQLMMLTAKFHVLDPHSSLIELKEFLPYSNRTDACIQQARAIESEFERRMDNYENNNGVCLDEHYMLIVDELPAIADREQQLQKGMSKDEKAGFRSLIDVLRRVVCEGRKYKMYCMIVGQSIPASVLPTIARNNMSTRYVFSCSDAHARMAGLEQETVEAFLHTIKGAKGRCIVAPGHMDAFIGAIPLTTVDDLKYVIATTGYQQTETDGNESVNVVDADVEPVECLPGNVSVFPKTGHSDEKTTVLENGNTLPDGVTMDDLRQIKQAYSAHWPLRDIARLVKMEGRNYGKFKAACAYLGINQAAAN